ncbi:Clp protease N-terminal domain-containing protein [Desulfobacca acetoxidans]
MGVQVQTIMEFLSESARQAVSLAFREAIYSRHGIITTPHLLIGLVKLQDGLTQRVLTHFQVHSKAVRDFLRQLLGFGNVLAPQRITMTVRFARVLEIGHQLASEAIAPAGSTPKAYIEEKHLLMAILQDGLKDPESVTMRALMKFSLEPQAFLAQVILMDGSDRRTSPRTYH